MQLSEEQAKGLRIMAKKNFVRVWLIAIPFTIGIVWLQAIVGKWFAGLVGVEISMSIAVYSVIITNLLVGVYNGFKGYGKSKTKKE